LFKFGTKGDEGYPNREKRKGFLKNTVFLKKNSHSHTFDVGAGASSAACVYHFIANLIFEDERNIA